jgi:hypothetical protein
MALYRYIKRRPATMTTNQYIITFLELAAIVFIIWGVFNEYKLIAFEDRIKEKIKNLLEVIQK